MCVSKWIMSFFIPAQIQKIKLKYHLADWAILLPVSLLLQHKVQSHRVLDVQPQASQLLASFFKFIFIFLMAYFPGWTSLEPGDKPFYICAWFLLSVLRHNSDIALWSWSCIVLSKCILHLMMGATQLERSQVVLTLCQWQLYYWSHPGFMGFPVDISVWKCNS